MADHAQDFDDVPQPACCDACGLPRAKPGDVRRNLRFALLAMVAAPTVEELPAALAALEPLARCWFHDAETCRAWHEREARERAGGVGT